MELDKIVMLMAAVIKSQSGATVEHSVKQAYQIVDEVKKRSDERDIEQLKKEAEFRRGR